MDQKQKDRVTCLLKLMEYDYLTDGEHNTVVSIESQFERKGWISDNQIQLLEDYNQRANERDRPFRR